VLTPSGYPDITLQNLLSSEGINIFQYVSIENSESIQQTVNITKIGVYELYFHYVARPTYSFNNLQIYFNNVLLDIVKTSQSSWTEYSYSFPITQTGIYVLMFQGQPEQPDNTSAFIGITNIKLYEPPSIIGSGIKTYNNNFKSTIINGYLKVVDISGTLGQLTTNHLTCNNNFIMPSDGQKSIYFKDNNNIIGRMFASTSQMYCDYYNIFSFRYCTKSNAVLGTKLNITSTGIIVNSSTTSSTYNLDVIGAGGGYIRGPLK